MEQIEIRYKAACSAFQEGQNCIELLENVVELMNGYLSTLQPQHVYSNTNPFYYSVKKIIKAQFSPIKLQYWRFLLPFQHVLSWYNGSTLWPRLMTNCN
jgi:hypothetical protein